LIKETRRQGDRGDRGDKGDKGDRGDNLYISMLNGHCPIFNRADAETFLSLKKSN
jgi:hypothetical protein